MASLGRVEKKSRDRVELKRPVAVRITGATKSTNTATITYNQPVVLKGTPAYTTNLVGVTALSATQPTLNQVTITFSASVATATDLIIPVADPAVRNKVGGFVADTTFPLA